jgi:glycosyltransferase involved in cell wall biosynthesis
MTRAGRLKALLVDPSLFTAPYDAGLSQGLVEAGVDCQWAIRPLRRGERPELPEAVTQPLFYRRVDRLSGVPAQLAALFKGLAHVVGLARLIRLAQRSRCDLVHIQWTVIPILDALAIWLIRRGRPVVVTVHDTLPFNGSPLPLPQRAGFFWPARLASEVIVHTKVGADRLAEAGVNTDKINIVPHGPLFLPALPRTTAPASLSNSRLKTFVLFGQMKPYKGIDILVEAIAALPQALRDKSRFIVAGAAMMDMTPIEQRIETAGVAPHIQLRYGRLDEAEMADLFREADVFVLPYRAVDASGVFYLLRPQAKWIIASRVGVFAEDFVEGIDGETVQPGDVEALARAISRAIDHEGPRDAQARGASWGDIGLKTRAIYERAIGQTGLADTADALQTVQAA